MANTRKQGAILVQVRDRRLAIDLDDFIAWHHERYPDRDLLTRSSIVREAVRSHIRKHKTPVVSTAHATQSAIVRPRG